jgi:nucleoside-diphosphate-sugar epimerase
MRILLIGHEGYLGRGLYNYLSQKHEVTGWEKRDDLFSLTKDKIISLKTDLVINLAVIAERAVPNISTTSIGYRVTVDGTRHVVQCLEGTDIMLIHMSTREVFGPVYCESDIVRGADAYEPRLWVKEDQPYAPINSYGKSKLISEFIAESHSRSNIIRLTTCYTDFDHPAGGWVLALLKNIAQKKPLTLTQGGRQFRDPLHVNDLGRMMELIYEKGLVNHKFHAGGGAENIITLKDFALLADSKAVIHEAEGGDLGFAFSTEKAERMLGWSPTHRIREHIPRILENIAAGKVSNS